MIGARGSGCWTCWFRLVVPDRIRVPGHHRFGCWFRFWNWLWNWGCCRHLDGFSVVHNGRFRGDGRLDRLGGHGRSRLVRRRRCGLRGGGLPRRRLLPRSLRRLRLHHRGRRDGIAGHRDIGICHRGRRWGWRGRRRCRGRAGRTNRVIDVPCRTRRGGHGLVAPERFRVEEAFVVGHQVVRFRGALGMEPQQADDTRAPGGASG